jgi:hypothetical protein
MVGCLRFKKGLAFCIPFASPWCFIILGRETRVAPVLLTQDRELLPPPLGPDTGAIHLVSES